MTNTKRLGRYRNYYSSLNNNKDNLMQFYKENNRKSLLNWDKPLFENKHTSLQKVLADANKAIKKSTKFINKIKSRQVACVNRSKSVPENATIRKEYIKCGKQICEQKHGPYYYAYWKDPESKKLKKKYIGDHIPKNKQLNYDCNNNQIL